MTANKSAAFFTNKVDVLKSFAGMEGDIQTSVIEGLKVTVMDVRNKLRDSLPDGSGEASTAGGQPFSQTGQLKKNIKATVLPPMLGKPITAIVRTGKDGFYGRMLEFGTSNMAARPWFYNFLLKQNPAMRSSILAGLEREVSRRQRMRGRYIQRKRMDKTAAAAQYQKDTSFLEAMRGV